MQNIKGFSKLFSAKSNLRTPSQLMVYNFLHTVLKFLFKIFGATIAFVFFLMVDLVRTLFSIWTAFFVGVLRIVLSTIVLLFVMGCCFYLVKWVV